MNKIPPIRIETLTTAKQEPSNRTERLKKKENLNTTHPSITKQILTQDGQMNIDLIKM